ncbi:MAG: hypothetical protein WCX17_02825 [Parcubacteria group bacterium]|jgi:Flp pilus assembly protein protease CpaA
MALNYIPLAIIFFISFFVLKEDWQYKKIRNKWIMLGFSAGAVYLVISYLFGIVSIEYLGKIVANTAISFLVGFLIWQFGFWPSGDAKFFTLIAFLLPLDLYAQAYLFYFPSFWLLFYSFAAFLVFIFFKALIFFVKYLFSHRGKSGRTNELIAEVINSKKLLNLNFWVKIGKRLAIGLLIYFIAVKFFLKTDFNFWRFIISLVVFAVVLALLDFYVDHNSRYKIKTLELKKGMNISKETLAEIKKDNNFPELAGKIFPEGLTEKQASAIKNYLAGRDIQEIYIFKTIPFAWWIVLGAFWVAVSSQRLF